MTNASNQSYQFASRPLAELQAEQRAAASAPTHPEDDRTITGEQVRPSVTLPALDIHFEDLPDESYEEFHFPLKTTPGIVYTLGIDDDSVLFEIMDVTRDGTPTEIIEFFFDATFRRAVYEDGTEVPNGLKFFQKAINGGKPGERESRRYLMSVALAAIDRWSEELTDTSMRPMNRAQRRARRR